MVPNFLFVIIIILIAFILVIAPLATLIMRRRTRQAREADELAEENEKRESTTPVTQKQPVVYGQGCAPGAICIGDVASASPDPSGLASARYVRESVTTNFHPFLIKNNGSSYMPLSSWWLLHGTQDACLGLSPNSIAFLTNHGLYHCSNEGSIRLCGPTTPKGKSLSTIFRHSFTIYALDTEGVMYRLLSRDEFVHYYKEYLSTTQGMVDCSRLSSKWYWQGVQCIYGHEIPLINSVTVVKESKSKEVLYLEHQDGILMYDGKRWMNTTNVFRRDVSLNHHRGSITVYNRQRTALRSARGTQGVICEGGNILFTLDDGWLIRTAEDVGNHNVRLSGGWVGLVSLENGVVIGISNDVSHALS